MSISTPNPTDERIESPLRKLSGLIRTYVSLEGVATIGIFLALWFWIGLVTDYGLFRLTRWDWVQILPWGLRASTLGLIVAALLALLVTRIVLRVWHEFRPSSLALLLEKRFPDVLGDRLITAIELADVEKASTYGYSGEMIRKTIRDVSDRVDQVPVADVFNWRRLVLQGLLFVGLTVGLLAIVFGGAYATQKVTGKGSMSDFVVESRDVATVWAERNLLLRDVPWPRDIYLEFPDFKGDELRIGRDGAVPRIRIVAHKWVIADRTVANGWRPMTWGEVTEEMLGGQAKPELPITLLQVTQRQLTYGLPGMALSPVPFSTIFAALLKPSDVGLRIPANLPQTPEAVAAWRVDEVERTFLLNEDVRSYLRLNLTAEELLALEGVFEQLAVYATDVNHARTVRMLQVPQRVDLEYWGAKTENEMTLDRTKEGEAEYVGTLTDLREDVWVRGSAGDAVTDTKRITLVAPPQLEIFERDEYRPAYLYHRAPIDTKLNGLRGQQQEFLHQGISRAGSLARFEIPMGTDLVLRGSADKPLVRARIVPKPGKFPSPDGVSEVEEIELKLVEQPDPNTAGQSKLFFEYRFFGPQRITRLTEFDLEITDTDNVSSKRLVQIQPIDDKAPDVDVVIEVIRKVGNTYICTPRAFVPFAKESRVRDDNGLNRVDYRFTYRQVDSAGVVNSRAILASGLFLGSPTVPALGSLTTGPLVVELYRDIMKPQENKAFSRIEGLEGFAELMTERIPKDVIDQVFRQRLKQAAPTGTELRIVRDFDFPKSEGFDLQKLAPDIDVKDENKYQPRYSVTLTVSATDSNVELPPKIATDRPAAMIVAGPMAGIEPVDGRTAENKESFTLTIVSEADLLTEISKEEEGLINKLDEIVTRLKDAQSKLNGIVDRLPTLKPEEMLADSTQAVTIAETISKCRDMEQDLLKDYQRILREYEVNRLNKQLIKKLDEQIVRPLEDVAKIDFPALDEPLGQFQAAFNEQRKPDIEVANATSEKLKVIVDRLSRVRDGVGEIVSIKKVIELIQSVLKTQENEIGPQLRKLMDIAVRDSLGAGLRPIAPVSVVSLQKAKVKVGVRFGLQSEDQITLKFETPENSDLTLPKEVKVNAPPIGEEVATVEFEIQAGAKKGDFPVKVVPSEGPTVTVIVTVK